MLQPSLHLQVARLAQAVRVYGHRVEVVKTCYAQRLQQKLSCGMNRVVMAISPQRNRENNEDIIEHKIGVAVPVHKKKIILPSTDFVLVGVKNFP